MGMHGCSARTLAACLALGAAATSAQEAAGAAALDEVEWWVSACAPPLKLLSCGVSNASALTAQPPLHWRRDDTTAATTTAAPARITITSSERYQTIYGIGSSLEASTDYNLHLLDPEQRAALLSDLFDPDDGIGMTLARITIATSDFTPPPFYSYDDLQDPSATDENLAHFTVQRDEAFVLPAIQAAIDAAGAHDGAADTLRLFASPWSPPAWMKDSNSLNGGALLKQHTKTYAKYLLRFLEEYAQRGVHVDALTVQNEPLQNDTQYPSMKVEPETEGEVIEAMAALYREQQRAANAQKAPMILKELPKIWCFDHNWGDEWYPETLLNSSRFAPYINGTAFHHYSGEPSAMTRLHDDHPERPIFMSEGSEFGVSGAARIVSYFRNWATTYTAWVTMLDQNRKPNNGPFSAGATMVELDTETTTVKRNFEYYMYGQFSKYVRTGAVRIGSEPASLSVSGLHHVAFANADNARGSSNAGAIVVVVANTAFEPREVELRCGGSTARAATLPARSVATFRWGGGAC